jgi:uncharacterized protein
VRTFERWKLGRKGIDDGLAVFILADDRTIAIEVGYGLEEKVPDVVAARIIREVMAPRLGAGDRDGAVGAGVDEILTAIEGKPWTGDGGGEPGWSPSPAEIVFAVLAIVAFAVFAIKNPRAAMTMLWIIVSFGRFGGRGRGAGGLQGGGGRSGGGGGRGRW